MIPKTRDLLKLAWAALKAEGITVAGRLNAFGLVLGVLLVVGAGLGDLAQIVIRLWNEDYTTGLPSFIAAFAVWGGIFLLCVMIVGLTTPRGPESGR